jgi:hypothetical protein
MEAMLRERIDRVENAASSPLVTISLRMKPRLRALLKVCPHQLVADKAIFRCHRVPVSFVLDCRAGGVRVRGGR